MSRFRDVIGHQRVLGLLDKEVARPANAYLFVGASGVGKATVARRFASALLCAEPDDHPVDECRVCRRAHAGSHPDLVLVTPEGRQSLGVEQARATISAASLSPVESDRKVFLLDDAGAMTEAAANALLKTLEEPSPRTVFVLVAESEQDLPATVASRCRTVHFGRVDEPELVAALEQIGVVADRAAGIARMAGGRPGLAVTLAGNAAAIEFRARWLSIPTRVSTSPGEAFRLASELLDCIDPLADAAVGEGLGREQADRRRRRARQDLLVNGLELVAGWYVDAAALQMGASIRNQDQPLADLTSIGPRLAVRNAELTLDAVADLRANLRPQLRLAELFTGLAESA